MAEYLLALIVALQVVLVLLLWKPRVPAFTLKAASIDAALKGAFTDCGLSLERYRPDLDLRSTGKLHEVLIHAAHRLGHELHTVRDLQELLK